jgi:hypothetical protein
VDNLDSVAVVQLSYRPTGSGNDPVIQLNRQSARTQAEQRYEITDGQTGLYALVFSVHKDCHFVSTLTTLAADVHNGSRASRSKNACNGEASDRRPIGSILSGQLTRSNKRGSRPDEVSLNLSWRDPKAREL